MISVHTQNINDKIVALFNQITSVVCTYIGVSFLSS